MGEQTNRSRFVKRMWRASRRSGESLKTWAKRIAGGLDFPGEDVRHWLDRKAA